MDGGAGAALFSLGSCPAAASACARFARRRRARSYLPSRAPRPKINASISTSPLFANPFSRQRSLRGTRYDWPFSPRYRPGMPELLVAFRRLPVEHALLFWIVIQIRDFVDDALVQDEVHVGHHDDLLSSNLPLQLSFPSAVHMLQICSMLGARTRCKLPGRQIE